MVDCELVMENDFCHAGVDIDEDARDDLKANDGLVDFDHYYCDCFE